MRIASLIAVSMLLAGCSQAVDGDAEQAQPSLTAPSAAGAPAPGTQPPTTSAKPTWPPAPGAAIGDVIDWIEAGDPADPAEFHVATRDGVATQLGDDVAFTTPAGTTTCMTATNYRDGALACLVDLVDPPPRPPDAYGEWKGGWVDFTGSEVAVGSVHGDPGPFGRGQGPQLPYGQALAFGDYRCRTDQTGLFCANYARRSAVGYSDEGVQTFGCLQPVTAPPQIGRMFRC